jgi:dTDP-4-dehydrorhamnose 3,5-epimerase
MKFSLLNIPEIILLEPEVFGDERGFFYESFNKRVFEEVIGIEVNFVQDNHSKSSKGVLRGLHYQLPPMSQGKLVRVIDGSVFDVAVDIREESETFGSWVGEILSSENKKQLWIPEGFAHGFYTISESAELVYKTTEFYSPEHERVIIWNDNQISIKWPFVSEPLLNERDTLALKLSKAEIFNKKDDKKSY